MKRSIRARLLVLASTFPASAQDGTPAFVRDLANVEASRFRTTVLAPAVPSGANFEHFSTIDVRRFRYFPRRWEDLAHGAILENLRARPSRWLAVPALLIAETAAIAREVRRSRPDVIHAHWIIPQGLAATIAARRVPMLVTAHGGDIYGLTDPVSRFVIRRVLRHAAQVTTMNIDMRDRLLALGADTERTHIVSMGVDVGAIQAAGRAIVRQPRRLLFVGRLVEKKGVAVLIDALREVPDRDQLVLRVVGSGPLRADLEKRARGLRVEFLGALPHEQVVREHAAAAVTVFPSVAAASGDQDGLPVALLEALASGGAVIASDLPGLNAAVHDRRSGLLVRPGDVTALAEAISTLTNDAHLREQLGIAARDRATEYDIAAIGARYVRILQSMTDMTASHRGRAG